MPFSPWIPVHDHLPDLRHVVALDQQRDVFIAVRITGIWFENTTGKRLNNITHWLPLPALPEVI